MTDVRAANLHTVPCARCARHRERRSELRARSRLEKERQRVPMVSALGMPVDARVDAGTLWHTRAVCQQEENARTLGECACG